MMRAAATHRTGIFVAIIFLSLSTFSCRKDDDAPGGPALQQQTVTIGAMLSLTGPGNTLGRSSLAALEIAVEDVNTYLDSIQGGINFGLLVRDTKLDSAAALTSLDWLSAAGAQIVIGPQSGAELAAVQSYAASAEVLVVSHSASAAALSIPGDNIFRFCSDDRSEGKAIGALLRADSIAAVIPIVRSDLGSISVLQSVQSSWTGFIAPAGFYPAAVSLPSDFASVVSDAHAEAGALVPRYGAGHIAVLCCGFEEQAALLRAAAADPLLINVKWYGGGGAAQSNVFAADTNTGSIAAGVVYTCPAPALDPNAYLLWSPLTARIAALTGDTPDTRALAAYDAFWVAAMAYVNVHGSGDILSLKAAFQIMADQHHGATGWTYLNANGDRPAGNVDFWKVYKSGTMYSWTKTSSYDAVLDRIVR